MLRPHPGDTGCEDNSPDKCNGRILSKIESSPHWRSRLRADAANDLGALALGTAGRVDQLERRNMEPHSSQSKPPHSRLRWWAAFLAALILLLAGVKAAAVIGWL
jgi:hypothetical protein